MLYRKFEKELENWKKKDKKPALLIAGARQIGKTTLIRDFASKHYECFVELNFVTRPSASSIFEGDISAGEIIKRLTAFSKKQLVPGKTLIFFDEVQECPNVRTAIKFLVDDGRFDYIESGSLLGVNYQYITSYAVGYEEIKMMYPMDFEEFAIAVGVQPETLNAVQSAYENRTPVDECIHKDMLNVFSYYVAVGGMPAVVQEYVTNGDMAKVYELQKRILNLYRLDIQKYSIDKKDKITHIFDTIPAELNNKNKRFMLSDLAKTARMERYESCFNWLTDAGVALPCYNLTQVKEPVEINKQHNIFKYYLADVGLLCTMCSGDVQYKIICGESDVNEGSIMENTFAEGLIANGFNLYYYDKASVGEVDFVVQQHGKFIPLEVKSGKDYKKHKALDNLLKIDEFGLQEAYVFCMGNVEVKDAVTYLPLYMLMNFKKENMLNNIPKLVIGKR